MRTFLSAIVFFIATLCCAGRAEKVNAPFDNKPNPFLQVLGLSTYQISLSRDSTRIKLKDGHIDLILRKKALWNISRYDRDGNRVDTGTLRDGTGTVRLSFDGYMNEASFLNGSLEGTYLRSWNAGRNSRPRVEYTFRDGLLDGISRLWSFWDDRYVSIVNTYSEGYLVQSDNYGRLRRWVAFLIMRPQVVDPEFLCSRTIYEKGKLVSHECFVPKCRRCAI